MITFNLLTQNDEKFTAMLTQYSRFAEDWRHISSLIWQLPSAAIAIMTGIIGVSFQFLDGLPRILLLGIGALFIFSLCIALAKHRLFHESRSVFMRDLENELRVTKFPTEGKETKYYLNAKAKSKDLTVLSSDKKLRENFTNLPLYNWLSSRKAAIWLLIVVFIAFLILVILSVLSALDYSGIVDLKSILGNQIHNATNLGIKRNTN